jgi:hypothetical protein
VGFGVSSLTASKTDGSGHDAETFAVKGDVGAFLGTMATLLRETVTRFEQTTDRVSDMVIAHTGRAGPDLVVAMQDFDRLQQEFSALVEVLSRMESATAGPWPSHLAVTDLEHELLHTIKVADLRKRLAQHFEHATEARAETPLPDDFVVVEF